MTTADRTRIRHRRPPNARFAADTDEETPETSPPYSAPCSPTSISTTSTATIRSVVAGPTYEPRIGGTSA